MKPTLCNLILAAFVVLVVYTLWSMKQECGARHGVLVSGVGSFECVEGLP